MIDLLTPRQAATAMGVSESSIRRWCDQGRMRGERTAGGHRRIRLDALVEFARENGIRISDTGAQGARQRGGRQAAPEELSKRVQRHATNGDDIGLRQLVADVVGAGQSVACICDRIIAPALHAIGVEWAAGRLDVYQEHRATETIRRVLANVTSLVVSPDETAPGALSCSLSPDLYSIAPHMAALVVQEAGFRSIHLGPNTPHASVAKAIRETRPALVVLSVSEVANENKAAEDLSALKRHAEAHGAALALGGRALNEDLRRRLTADFFGDTMEHLSGFASHIYRRELA